MPYDNLYIRVLSTDEQTNQLFNANEGSSGLQFMVSYPVDEDGNINYQFIGNVNVRDLTISEASAKIQSVLSDYVPRASIIVRFVDNKVTVIGQVEHQGLYTFSQ